MTEERKSELRRFLRAMRARLEPGDVGLPPLKRRRRTPGLRIEEAAAVAGVSLTWYSALEGGKDIRVSADLLDRVAQSLRLSESERHFFFTLATAGRTATHESSYEADTSLEQRTVDGFTGGPAFVADGFWNVFAYNAMADALYGFGDVSERNLLVRMFDDPSMRRLHLEWERVALEMTEMLHDAYALVVDDAEVNALLTRLRGYADFVRWWDSFGVRPFTPTSATLDSPIFGVLALTYASYMQSPGRRAAYGRVLVFQTAADEATAQRLVRSIQSEKVVL